MAGKQISQSQARELRANPGFYLEPDAAKAWDRACAEFGKQVLLSGALRSIETQIKLFDGEKFPNQTPQYGRYARGNRAGQRGFTTDVRGREADGSLYRGSWWTRKAGTAAAAVPGTSNHGSGRAVDVKTSRSAGDPAYPKAVVWSSWNDADRREFLRVAAKHGWDDDEGRKVNEVWHLTYYPERDRHRGQTAPVDKIPEKEDFLMAISESAQKQLVNDVKAIKGHVDDKVLMGPWNDPKKQEHVTLARAARLNFLQAQSASEGVKALRAEVRGLRSTLDALVKNMNLDPERIYQMVDENLREATRDLKITFAVEEEKEKP
jgi:hypothetical protein